MCSCLFVLSFQMFLVCDFEFCLVFFVFCFLFFVAMLDASASHRSCVSTSGMRVSPLHRSL